MNRTIGKSGVSVVVICVSDALDFHINCVMSL